MIARAMQLGSLHFEPLAEADFPLLHKWLNLSHIVAHWGGPQSLSDIEIKYRAKIGSDWQQAYIVSKDGKKFGYIQSYCTAKAPAGCLAGEGERTFGIDQFIGELSCLEQGLGTEMVREFSNWLLLQPHIDKVVTDPSPDNLRAIRCYKKAGFEEVKLLNTANGKALWMAKTRCSAK